MSEPAKIEYAGDARKTPGAAKPAKLTTIWPLASGLACVAVAGGVWLSLVDVTTNRCMGATRSVRLNWEARQQEIEQMIADAQQ